MGQIARELNFSKDKIRKTLLEGGAVLRPSNSGPKSSRVAARGSMVCGSAPYGFMYHHNKLVVNPKEISAVRRVIDLRSKGFKVTAIARKINDLKIKTRKGTQWDHSLVVSIVRRYDRGDRLYREALK